MMSKEYHFYDTSALLNRAYDLFKNDEQIVISTTVLEELENIKTSKRDEIIKSAARRVLRVLDENPDKYFTVIFKSNMLKPIRKKGFSEETSDLKILAAAIEWDNLYAPDNTIFYTNDIALKTIANLFFGEDSIRSVLYNSRYLKDEYTGYKLIQMNSDEMADFYQNHQNDNPYQQFNNEYLFIQDEKENIVDTLCWTGEEFRKVKYNVFSSKMFGSVKPKRNDVYQACAFDSLLNNKITLLKGPAGSGKSYIAISYLMSQFDKGEIDKIIIFCNTIATKNSAKLGFYPGSRDEKLLDSQIGNFLSSKFGSKFEVEQMIEDGVLMLLPMSDVRGYDTTGMRAGIYITEAQNMDISLMKLALQRVGEDSKVIIDGDCDAQVDDIAFEGANNGMKRLSQVFRGETIYGEIELKNIHRSKIASIAQKM